MQLIRPQSANGPIRRLPGCLLALALLLPAAAVAQGTAWDAAIARFEARVARDVGADDVGGSTAAVVVGDRVVWARGFGWADRERRIPADVRTIYRIGSISKSFTAVAMMRLVERGVLALDDPVVRYMPEVAGFADRPEGAAPITFRQLASHTAGLIREPELEDAAAGPVETWEHKILASIPATSFQSVPGTEYSYSNIGYGVLGLAIGRAAGVPFTVLVREEITEPLGMASTTFVLTPDLFPRLAKGYSVSEEGSVSTERPAYEHRGRGYKVPNGGIYSTVGDLARFLAAQTGAATPALLSAESRAEMQRVQTPEGGERRYGLGVILYDGGSAGTLVGHSGSVSGYNAHLVVHPESKVGVVMLRNYNRGEESLDEYTEDLLTELVAARQQVVSYHHSSPQRSEPWSK